MLVTYCALVRSAKPSLKQAGHPMAKGKQVCANILGFTNNLEIVAQGSQSIVPLPPIRLYLRTRDNRFMDRRFNAFG